MKSKGKNISKLTFKKYFQVSRFSTLKVDLIKKNKKYISLFCYKPN